MRASAATRRGRVARLPAMALLFLLGWSVADSVSAQETASLTTVPPLSAAFPLEQRGREVHVRYPLAVNEHVVVPPDARLHFLYARPQRAGASGEEPTSAEEGEPSARRGGGGILLDGMGIGGMGLGGMRMATAGGIRQGMSGKGEQREKPSRRKIDRKMVWTSCDAFREALVGWSGSELRLVFSLPGPKTVMQKPASGDEDEDESIEEPRPQPRRVRDAPVHLPLGLLLAQRKGASTVLAVEEASAGEQAGFRARDRILSLDGRPCPKSLSGVLALYRQKKALGRKELSVAVERAGASTPVSLLVPLSPRLEGSLLKRPVE
ncbi:PDZ domain-containing protein [Verrucomicrobium sp. 3C]|uniref:PDZ domain-containing protein n=1 Tax=Verrucomicrobium sp. 3C TaxID=1134055 RepID=UPI0003AA64E9|nr:PDZ domain-containing protein [Verrucomicrobium sp. 3C]